MPYTRKDLDCAIEAVLGAVTTQAMRAGGISITQLHRAACDQAFLDNSQAPHVEVLREAARDLRDRGVYGYQKEPANV